MLNFNRKCLCSLLVAIILLAFFPIVLAQGSSFEWNPELTFKLPATNTIISFANTAYFDSFEWDSWNASAIKFYNVLVSGDEVALPSFGLSVENANATINYINKGGKGEIVLSAPSGTTSILTLYYPNNYPPAIGVTSGSVTENIPDSKYFRSINDWKNASNPAVCLNESSKFLKIKAKHSSDVVINFYWIAKAQEEKWGGPSPLTPTITTTQKISIPLTPENIPNLIFWGMVIIAIIIIIKANKKERTADYWKKRRIKRSDL